MFEVVSSPFFLCMEWKSPKVVLGFLLVVPPVVAVDINFGESNIKFER